MAFCHFYRAMPHPAADYENIDSIHQEVYLHDYQTVSDASARLGNFFRFYNDGRLHKSLGYQVPAEVYRGEKADCSAVLFISPLPLTLSLNFPII